MLSSILNSVRTLQVNIAIMRVFVRLRQMLAAKLAELENRLKDHDEQILAIFEAIRRLVSPPKNEKKKIGFQLKEPKLGYRKT